jgi:nitrogen fixation protein NifB
MVVGGPSYHSYRPAVCDRILSPAEALELVDSRSREEELKVIGIAGPGEPLFNEETFQTLELLGSRYPERIFCLSTNGLLLPARAEELDRIGVSTVTVTINTLRPDTAEKIYRHAFVGGEHLFGSDAARAITSSQIEGVRTVADLGIKVKVNTILMPGINQDEVGEIARNARMAGACIQNITPLIPTGDMKDKAAPTCRDLILAREQGGAYIDQFRLCRQCRADSVGVPGRGDGLRPSHG